MEIRPMLPQEKAYAYRQLKSVFEITGNVGYLRGDFDKSGNGFFTTWFDNQPQLKTDEFKAELDKVINTLRFEKGLLKNRSSMQAYILSNPKLSFMGNFCMEYGYRIDTDKFSYLLRCNPNAGDYNFYCYCYLKQMLDRHLHDLSMLKTAIKDKEKLPER